MSKEVDEAFQEEEDNKSSGQPAFVLRLYVTGASLNSLRAISNLKQICESHIRGRYSLEIIDIYQQRQVAETEQVIALPLLVKTFPLPERRLIGDMSDTKKVLRGLGLVL